MANPQKKLKLKDDAWIGIIVGVIIVYAFLASWWAQHAVLGWIILIILLAVAGYLLYRYASLRGWLRQQAKGVVQAAIFERVASEREPLSWDERARVMQRAHNRCENEQCTHGGKPHIHHIDANNQHNNLGNLVALCPNCHQQAHDGILSESQLINWVRRDFNKLKASTTESTGHCIRCNKRIAYNSKAPYCPDCYGVWAGFNNSDYQEKYCHKCGASNKSASKNRPLCISCFKESKR
ncbi:MAG: HNH endonuclease signature motif containing protein [Dehalococcoidales bacterium]|nr:HNH endonuclease signature motif containing protein [Dehalococcoidales bacterium]